MTKDITAQYIISDTFRITGRGIVFAGYIESGVISIGDTIEFTAFGTLRQRSIIGVEGIRKAQPDKVNTGLLIKCNSDEEIEELKVWQPENTIAIVYKMRS